MNKKTLIFGGIAIFVFIIFLLLLFLLLGRQDASPQTQTQIDENRAPAKTQIENTSRKFIPTDGPSPTESPIELDYSKRIDDDKQIEDSQLKNSPDVYLYNKLPHESSSFSMTADLVDGGNGAIKFTVIAKGEATEARDAAIAWMKSIDLEENVIATFDISYPQ